MTPWLRATVLAILVGTSVTAVPQTDRAYGAELTPLVPAGAPARRAADSVPFQEPPRGTTSTSASVSATRSPDSAPAHQSLRKTARPYATVLPSHTSPGGSASPSGIPRPPAPAHGPRHPASASAGPPGLSRGHGPERASPSASLAPSPSAAPPSRAGSRAGEGRERPGRPEEPVTEDADADGAASAGTDSGDDDLTGVSEPPPQTAVARPSRPAQRPVAGPKVFILPLGTGLVLVGLGLGLGLYALRVRRG
ncbi:hypothetical protein [Streptomyces canus]|uniref:hypothetical protein n=1 Tax=Streptomyces canus TaxID=58343 RepID=UPI000382452D|nr:hypothetical protein [Streptomyces canus]